MDDMTDTQAVEAEQPTRRPYETPQLTLFGDIDALTGDVGAAGTDGITGSRLV